MKCQRPPAGALSQLDIKLGSNIEPFGSAAAMAKCAPYGSSSILY